MVKCWHSRCRIFPNKTNKLSFSSVVPMVVNQLTSPSVHSIILHPSETFISPPRESILAEVESFKYLGSKIKQKC
jgi:hypothetical protein